MAFLDLLKWLFGTERQNTYINAMKVIYDEYRHKIDEQNKIIQQQDDMRGKPMDIESIEIQYERERAAHEQLIECLKEKRDLQEEIIFLNIELSRLKAKK